MLTARHSLRRPLRLAARSGPRAPPPASPAPPRAPRRCAAHRPRWFRWCSRRVTRYSVHCALRPDPDASAAAGITRTATGAAAMRRSPAQVVPPALTARHSLRRPSCLAARSGPRAPPPASPAPPRAPRRRAAHRPRWFRRRSRRVTRYSVHRALRQRPVRERFHEDAAPKSRAALTAPCGRGRTSPRRRAGPRRPAPESRPGRDQRSCRRRTPASPIR